MSDSNDKVIGTEGEGLSAPREGPIRVLVVDDSAFARKVLREVLSRNPRIEVVGAAMDGLDALEKIVELRPEVVTLDLMMPALDGISLLKALPPPSPPSVIIVSISNANSEIAIEALQAGAFDLVHKPTALATARLYEMGEDLVSKVIAAGEARRAGRRRGAGPTRSRLGGGPRSPSTLLVIGTSTGGPQALTRLLGALPADLPVPIAIALHIPEGYTRSMAERLSKVSPLEVLEAGERTELRPGRAVIAQGGSQMTIERDRGELVAVTGPRQEEQPFAPSVDLLFESAARAAGAGALALVLTGMGDDGLIGARAIRAAGGVVLTESESSCVVFGMPRVVAEAGLSMAEAPLDGLVGLLVSTVEGSLRSGS